MSIEDYEPNALTFDENGEVMGRNGRDADRELSELKPNLYDPTEVNPAVLPLASEI
jgi:hypothetical protein